MTSSSAASNCDLSSPCASLIKSTRTRIAIMASTELTALIKTATSTLSLLRRCTAALYKNTDAPPTPNAPDPLEVLHDAAKLLKAHTTKLSLLVINKPFTPSAIRKIIAELASGCFPAMMSAVEICRPDVYGRALHEEVQFRVRRVMREHEGMMEEVIARGQELQKSGGKQVPEKENRKQTQDSLKSTGVVWEACDSLMGLKTLGVVGVVVKKAEEYRATLQDAIEELKDWGEGEDEGFSEPEFSDDADEIERMMGSQSKLPADREDLRVTLDSALKKLKLIGTLYQALIKRRLKTMEEGAPDDKIGGFSVLPLVANRVDRLLEFLRTIPDETDELASAFYDLDDAAAQEKIQDICKLGRNAIDVVRLDWDGQEDEFSTWSGKWIEAVQS